MPKMPGRADTSLSSTRRPRKSTGYSPVRKRMEKENITVDVASSLASNAGRKKSRSKSMGPGGLDVLKSTSGNRRVSLAAPIKPLPRSILKPTIPLLPDIPPHKPKLRKSPPSGSVQGTENLANPFHNDDSSSSGTKIALRTEEEQHAAAREREEKERAQLEKEINDRREARRKSLANRRVSFAAEATLHTFHEVEYMQDSTTSTDNTRRTTSSAARPSAQIEHPDPTDPPSTPPEQVEETALDSPEHQRDLHQKKRRRSSGVSSLGFTDHDDMTLASSVYSSDSDVTEGPIEEIRSDSDSDSDADGVSVDELTGTSVASAMSARSAFTSASNDTLDEALRQATRQAITQSLDEEEEIIPSFGWARKPASKTSGPTGDRQFRPENSNEGLQEDDTGMDMDMDMTNVVGGIIRSRDDSDDDQQNEEMSMDVTRALGGILPERTRDLTARPVGLGGPREAFLKDDATMEFTTAVGGIRKGTEPTTDLIDFDENEDMSMELTSVVGGVVSGGKPQVRKRKRSLGRRWSMAGENEATMDMDMTAVMGRIILPDEVEESELNDTAGMDLTISTGRIIKGPSPVKDRTQAKHLMEKEVDEPESPIVLKSPTKRRLSQVSGSGSPGLSAFRGKGLRHSNNWLAAESSREKSPVQSRPISRSPSPVAPTTPSTPLESSPLKTPASQKSQACSVSPRRSHHKATASTPRSATRNSRMSVFHPPSSTGVATPQIVLTPQGRRLSGVGADRSGLGSPKVAELFDRRSSIGDFANGFVPRSGRKGVSFADPKVMESEVDQERQRDNDKENGQSILEREEDVSDNDNMTITSLKDMISNMTPKKNPVKGRKSLHVGSAKGLLGKRPTELEDEDDLEDRDGVKRLKNHQSSPVKNVRLHAPPTKEETTGRLLKSTSGILQEINGPKHTPTSTLSPKKNDRLTRAPHGQGRFQDVNYDQPTSTFTFHEAPVSNVPRAEGDDKGDHIHLQDFLNVTSIRFMELTTTKRRHTQAPTSQKDVLPNKDDLSLERCVVAGACTVPMLELYQHSCRELKKYISEGRRIIREIEMETLEENPPLFREYMSASPDIKTLMDNQFKNVKTHARLLSKAMWYEWRMKLQDGLKEGLVKIAEGMIADEKLLQKGHELLDSALPGLVAKFESLQMEHENLETVAQELADCDPEDLQSTRAGLIEVEDDIQAKIRKIQELREQLSETEASIDVASKEKQAYIAQIGEAEKIREECKGWSSNEISSLKANVDVLERKHGWAITGMAGTSVSMTYRREIRLVIDVSAFQPGQESRVCLGATPSAIDLWHITADREHDLVPVPPEKEFFVQCGRDYVRALQSTAGVRVKDILKAVGVTWQKANLVAENVRLLDCTFPTVVTRTSDDSIAIKTNLLLRELETKVEIVLELRAANTRDGVEVRVVPQARVVYGEQFKTDKVVEYLATRIGDVLQTKEENPEAEGWSDVILELWERLLARGRK
ncbi:Spc7-domain-containing protein [Xylariaceae sp. FL0016]|nr:Spc7-domain-containing protein [Xylariaceae sp. FL0016]